MAKYNSTEYFNSKTLMITGGTGSFGTTVLKRFLTSEIGEIRIFSRDEKKQDDLRHELQAKHPDYSEKVRFFIGDVRDFNSIRDAVDGVGDVFGSFDLGTEEVKKLVCFSVDAP